MPQNLFYKFVLHVLNLQCFQFKNEKSSELVQKALHAGCLYFYQAWYSLTNRSNRMGQIFTSSNMASGLKIRF